MNFIATHVFREGNTYADALANVGLSLTHLRVWLHVPNFIRARNIQVFTKKPLPRKEFCRFHYGLDQRRPPNKD